jgi:phosphoenolpyruvate---glycerone phosphotransferase subunit DhaL
MTWLAALRRLLIDGLQAVQDGGKAKPGDKTMVDALAPAAETAASFRLLLLTSSYPP